MKKISILLSCILLCSCFRNWEENPTSFSNYEAVLLDRTTFEKSIVMENAKEVKESSKIYIIEDYIFINDKREGFHIFDNRNPSNPIKKKFLKAPGATDIAIRNNTLYINHATDLVTLTLNFNTFQVTLNKRIRNVFPELRSPDGDTFFDKDKVVVNWVEK